MSLAHYEVFYRFFVKCMGIDGSNFRWIRREKGVVLVFDINLNLIEVHFQDIFWLGNINIVFLEKGQVFRSIKFIDEP